MSVIVFGNEEIGSIYKTLEQEIYHDSIYNLVKLDRADPEILKVCYDNDEVKYKRTHLHGFISRLWIANQCAGIAQYGHHEDYNKTIKMFDSDDKLGQVLAEHELYSEVNSLLYNLYTNGGNCFAQTKDIKFLENIVGTIAVKHTDQKFRDLKDKLDELERKRELSIEK